MTKLLTTTAVAMLLGMSPAFALEEGSQPKAAEEAGQTGELPTTSNVTEETAKEAKNPDEGSADESGGAMERSSAPPESGAVIDSDDDASKSSAAAGESGSDVETSKE